MEMLYRIIVKMAGYGLVAITLSAQAGIINPIKPIESLNLHHMAITHTFDSDKSIHGLFCATADFTKINTEKNQPPILLYIVKNRQKADYYGTMMGSILLVEEDNPNFAKAILDITKFPSYQQQCGKNTSYPERYVFQFSFNNVQGDKSSFYRQRQQILEQVHRQGYLDIMAVRVPFMSLFKPILISQQPTRLYFTPEQIRLISSPDIRTIPQPSK